MRLGSSFALRGRPITTKWQSFAANYLLRIPLLCQCRCQGYPEIVPEGSRPL